MRAAARVAEDAGDLDGALRLVRRLAVTAETAAWRLELQEARDWLSQVQPFGGSAPLEGAAAHIQAAAVHWLVRPALRWALERPAGDLLGAYAALLLRCRGELAAARARRLHHTCLSSPVVIDAALFEGGLLGRYLADSAAGAIASWALPLSWSTCAFSVFRVLAAGDGIVRLIDCYDLREVSCVSWAAAPRRDGVVAGRLLRLAGERAGVFAVGPTPVDPRCAARLLRARQRRAGAEERIRAVARQQLRSAS